MCKAWEGFTAGAWQSRIDVRDFIQKNYTPYGGDEAFLAPATPRTQAHYTIPRTVRELQPAWHRLAAEIHYTILGTAGRLPKRRNSCNIPLFPKQNACPFQRFLFIFCVHIAKTAILLCVV